MTKKLLIYLSGISFAVFFFWHFSLAVSALLLHFTLNKWLIYGSVVLTFATMYTIIWFITRNSYTSLLAVIPAAVLILGMSYGVVVNHSLYDTSFDGQSYQGEAVVSMINGWNPIFQPESQFINQYVTWSGNSPWLNSYPKASWYLSASMYDLTGHYTDVKFFNLSVLFGAFLVLYAMLSEFNFAQNRGLSEAIKFVLSAFIILNPVAVVQATSLNLDGLLYAFLLMFFVTGYFIFRSFEDGTLPRPLYYTMLSILIIIIVNTKTAGFVYTAMFSVAFGAYLLLFKLKHLWAYLLVIILSFSLAVGVFGYNPYITNGYLQGNILYPSFGKNSFSFAENTPSNYRTKSNIELFVHSLFFATNDTFKDGEGEPAELKLPFVVSSTEINSLANSQIKKGGFGPLFSGVLVSILLAFIAAAGSKFKQLVEHNPYTQKSQQASTLRSTLVVLLISIVAFLSFTLTNTSNTARYIPHLWFLLGVYFIYIFNTKFQIARMIASFALIIGFVNIALISYFYFSTQMSDSVIINKNITNLVYSGDSYRVNFGYHTSARQLFLEHQIPFTPQSEELNCYLPQDQSGIYKNNTTGTCIINQ
jgi:hypothetical protein